MALHFDVSKIANKDEVTAHPTDTNRWHPVTEMLVQLLMVVGMTDITEKNFYRVWVRINAYECVAGSMLKALPKMEDPEVITELVDRYITIEDVRTHIGLSTNVMEMTGEEYAIKLYGIARDRAYYKIREDVGGSWQDQQAVTYPLEQQEQHGTLDCGCAANLVADEGHQEGCEQYEPYDEEG